MRLINVLNARKSLEDLSGVTTSAHLCYLMAKFISKTDDEYAFYSTEVEKIFKKHAQTKEDGTLFVPAQSVPIFNVEVDELGQTDVEAPNIKFKLSELTALQMSMKQMLPLLDFIEEDE